MKAEELMIGDWVLLRHTHTKEKTAEKVLGIGRDVILYRNEAGVHCVDQGLIEPMRLTEEILQKNNFTDYAMRNPSANTGYLLRSHNSAIYVNPDKLKFMFRWENNGESVCKLVRYVHELQHLLRLSGCNDIADNFKI